ncbi:MAG TPA: citramalate synthase, partial [Clostridia bacterium]|nr:citramalate synthase [Clostridia bacterium]
DAEYFFDGFRADPGYAFAALSAAARGGADVLCLCDTNGGSYCSDLGEITAKAVGAFDARVAIHCHNDMGLAVANTMAAVDRGATQVQGTFIGFGERCGNTSLCTVIPNLQIKRGCDCIPEENMTMITSVSRKIAEIANVTLANNEPYVGVSAFAHKGGMHIDGVRKINRSFEHISPDLVGNERRFLMSEVSGRTTVLTEVNKLDPEIHKDSEQTRRIMARIKELEHFGYQFEAAQASVELLIRKELGRYSPFFKLEHYSILGEQPVENENECSTAVIKILVDGKTEITAAQGDGPVHALDSALKKALMVFYPSLSDVRLTDYKVRVMEPKYATASKVRVLIESSDGTHLWSTVGVSRDIIDASWIALVDSIDYKLTLEREKRESGRGFRRGG